MAVPRDRTHLGRRVVVIRRDSNVGLHGIARLTTRQDGIRQILGDIHARLRTALDAEPEELRCLL